MSGIGIAVLPEKSIQKEIHNGQLVELNWIRDLETSVVMIWHKDRRISEVLQNFMEHIRKLKDK